MKNKMQKLHIAIIVVGVIFILLGAFQSNIWFDEAYSVAMAERTITEIWTIGGNDVHPVLYYWMLRIISLITNAWGITSIAWKIIIYRIFSVIPMALLGVLGYTHIKKDFGEKAGMLFSFLVFFLPESAIYGIEIRMYSWAILAVTILGIYAYRLRLSENSNRRNWIMFFISSISSIFLHYYGLMAAGLINVVLLIYLTMKKRGKDILSICIFGLIQLVAYIPWLMYFVSQLTSISKGFWIQFKFPDTLYELVGAQLAGNLDYKLGFVIAIILYIYLGIKLFKYKGDKKPAIFSVGIYLAVILAAIIMTKVLHTSILYYRYLFVITGLYIFAISFILSKEQNNKIIWCICAIIAILATMSNIKLIQDVYSENNGKQYKYLQDNIEEGDQIVYKEIGHGSTMSVYFSEYEQYFYNPENWHVEEAYKAFGPNFATYITPEFVSELNKRIWIIDDTNKTLYNQLFNNENYSLRSEKEFWTEYHDYAMNMILVEKVND